jgi:hypothetical protein
MGGNRSIEKLSTSATGTAETDASMKVAFTNEFALLPVAEPIDPPQRQACGVVLHTGLDTADFILPTRRHPERLREPPQGELLFAKHAMRTTAKSRVERERRAPHIAAQSAR